MVPVESSENIPKQTTVEQGVNLAAKDHSRRIKSAIYLPPPSHSPPPAVAMCISAFPDVWKRKREEQNLTSLSNTKTVVDERRKRFKPAPRNLPQIESPPVLTTPAFGDIDDRRKRFRPALHNLPQIESPVVITPASGDIDERRKRCRFLAACNPPMIHFLAKFIAFGCNNENFVLAVKTWSDDVIDSFLNFVSLKGGNESDGTFRLEKPFS